MDFLTEMDRIPSERFAGLFAPISATEACRFGGSIRVFTQARILHSPAWSSLQGVESGELGKMNMNTITKRDLVQRISESTGVQQQKAKEVIQEFLDSIIQELAAGNRLEFRDFGVFEPKSKAARMARNPRTGDRIAVPEKVTVKFKSGRMMKEKLQPEGSEEASGDSEVPPTLS